MSDEQKQKKKLDRQRLRLLMGDAWELIWRSRGRLLLGVPLLLINRLTNIILPGVTKYLIDDVFVKGRHELLWKLAMISAIAAAVGAMTDYALAQILGMAAQRGVRAAGFAQGVCGVEDFVVAHRRCGYHQCKAEFRHRRLSPY